MRVLIVTNMYPSKQHLYYGIFVQEYVDSLRKQGVHVDVFFTNAKRTRAAYLTELPALLRQIRSQAYDIVHAQHTYCVFQLALLRPWLRNRPALVFTIHEAEAFRTEDQRDTQADVLKQFVYVKRFKRWALESADRVVSVERRLPQIIGYRGFYETIAPGVDTDLFSPMEMTQARKILNLPEKKPIIFFPASPRERDFQKNYKLFQQSQVYLKSSVHVLTAGALSHKQMPLYMNAANLIVQTSRYEASPMVVKEAMACNRPMVSTDVGDVREFFGDLPGYLLCANDPQDVAAKIERALQFGQPTQGRARVFELQLSLGQTAQKYLSVYERLCQTEKEKVYAHS
jgi:glycosyltransferase involved in cell wall biosynthesis